jgi:hypothetical protein
MPMPIDVDDDLFLTDDDRFLYYWAEERSLDRTRLAVARTARDIWILLHPNEGPIPVELDLNSPNCLPKYAHVRELANQFLSDSENLKKAKTRDKVALSRLKRWKIPLGWFRAYTKKEGQWDLKKDDRPTLLEFRVMIRRKVFGQNTRETAKRLRETEDTVINAFQTGLEKYCKFLKRRVEEDEAYQLQLRMPDQPSAPL